MMRALELTPAGPVSQKANHSQPPPMKEPNQYIVEMLEQPGGPDAALRARLAVVLAFRLTRLEVNEGHYPKAGGEVDMLDNFNGPYLWEMSDADLEANPPSRVDFEIVDVDPAEPPAAPGTVKVSARVVF